MKELELLAPARNADIGIAAIDCGADAVYIAGPKFGARQAAGNSIEDIGRLCKYAHKYGCRVFVTVNTIIYDDELDEAAAQVEQIVAAGADALIVQDPAVCAFVRERGLDIALHASTQCAIRTPERALMLEKLGFSRVILERELSIDEISAIRRAVRCEMEFFVHGALCVCYSGQCYLSEYLTGRSANRGACIQACRSLYDLCDQDGKKLVKGKALLSLKDYNLSARLEDLARTGISSFKIEGRLKNESYVRNVVREYSLALDSLVRERPQEYCRASFGSVERSFKPSAEKTFNRGYTELYLDGRRGSWASMDAAKGMGQKVGTVVSVNRARTEFMVGGCREKFANGDGLSFIAKNGRICGFRADVAVGNRISCKAVPELHVGAVLYRNYDAAFEKQIKSSTGLRSIEVGVEMDISYSKEDDRFEIRAAATSEDGRIAVKTIDAGNEKAANIARMKSMLDSQMSKSVWHYDFHIEDIVLQDEGMMPLMSASAINALRRELAAAIDSEPCNCRPLLRSDALPIPTEAGAGTMAEGQSKEDGATCPKELDYSWNVANRITEGIYRSLGAKEIQPAYELSHPSDACLMRTRYCIRHELGMCLKDNPAYKGPLYLENNGRKLALHFDCRHCEMTVCQGQ